MTPTEIEEMVVTIARCNPGVAQSEVVNGIAKLCEVPKSRVSAAIKSSYPIRPYKQSNGRVRLWVLRPRSHGEHYGEPSGVCTKACYRPM